MYGDMINYVDTVSSQTTSTSITRRDFLKLKSFLLVWFYFLQSFGINIFEENKKIDYSLLDKLLKLPFSEEVKKEVELRVMLQKEYCTDMNGNLISLERFMKEIINFVVYKKDFNDFKLLNSIKDKQIDYSYMFISTARHNEIKSMKYLQNRLLTIKDSKVLNSALEYAIKSKSYKTTLHLMQQNIKLDKKSQESILKILRSDEYERFYEDISGNKHMFLPSHNKKDIIRKEKMQKKMLSLDNYDYIDKNFIYSFLSDIVYNSLVDLYNKNIIYDFTLRMINKKVHTVLYAKSYPINFIKEFESTLLKNGFSSWREELNSLYYFLPKDVAKDQELIDNFLYNQNFRIDDFINVEMEL